MATLPEITLPPQQTLIPPKDVPSHKAGFIIGQDDKPQDERTVAVTIGLRATMRTDDKEMSAPICMHELIILRRYYEEQNGSVRVETGWIAGLPRHRSLTQSDLASEVKRMRESYRIHRSNDVLELMEMYYGTEPTAQIRKLHEVMKKQAEAWAKLLPILMARAKPTEGYPLQSWNAMRPEIQLSAAYDAITEQELNRIINLADPSTNTVEDLVLEQVFMMAAPEAPSAPPVNLADVQAAAEAEADAGASPIDKLMDELEKTAGLSPSAALQVASLVEKAGVGGTIGDGDIAAALGSKSKVPAVRAVLSKYKG